MKKRLATEIRTSLGWTTDLADKHFKLSPGTWQRIENGQQAVSIKQLISLFKAALLRSFGAKTLQFDELEAFKAELYKAQGIMLELQQNCDISDNFKEQTAQAITAIQKIDNLTS